MKVRKIEAEVKVTIYTDGKHIFTHLERSGFIGAQLISAVKVINIVKEDSKSKLPIGMMEEMTECYLMTSKLGEEVEVPDDFFNKKEEV